MFLVFSSTTIEGGIKYVFDVGYRSIIGRKQPLEEPLEERELR